MGVSGKAENDRASLVPSNMQAEAASHLGGDLVPDRNGDKNF